MSEKRKKLDSNIAILLVLLWNQLLFTFFLFLVSVSKSFSYESHIICVMFEQLESQEENIPMMAEEDSESIDRLVEPDELSFSWFLSKLVKEVRKLCGSDYVFFKQKHLSYHIQLLLTFIMFIVAIVVGSIHLNDCSNERMICIFLIVQGVCGLFVVLIHISAAVAQ